MAPTPISEAGSVSGCGGAGFVVIVSLALIVFYGVASRLLRGWKDF